MERSPHCDLVAAFSPPSPSGGPDFHCLRRREAALFCFTGDVGKAGSKGPQDAALNGTFWEVMWGVGGGCAVAKERAGSALNPL